MNYFSNSGKYDMLEFFILCTCPKDWSAAEMSDGSNSFLHHRMYRLKMDLQRDTIVCFKCIVNATGNSSPTIILANRTSKTGHMAWLDTQHDDAKTCYSNGSYMFRNTGRYCRKNRRHISDTAPQPVRYLEIISLALCIFLMINNLSEALIATMVICVFLF